MTWDLRWLATPIWALTLSRCLIHHAEVLVFLDTFRWKAIDFPLSSSTRNCWWHRTPAGLRFGFIPNALITQKFTSDGCHSPWTNKSSGQKPRLLNMFLLVGSRSTFLPEPTQTSSPFFHIATHQSAARLAWDLQPVGSLGPAHAVLLQCQGDPWPHARKASFAN